MKLRHPNGGPTVETTRDKAEVYISQGWAEVKPPAKKTSSLKAQKAVLRDLADEFEGK